MPTKVTTAPGSEITMAQCSYCSLMVDLDNIPTTCKRCGAPMDTRRVGKFADEQASTHSGLPRAMTTDDLKEPGAPLGDAN